MAAGAGARSAADRPEVVRHAVCRDVASQQLSGHVPAPVVQAGPDPCLDELGERLGDPAGLVSQVWVLTPEEARAERASAEQPGFFNFWPFASSSGSSGGASRIDPLTPYNQLPSYGE